MIQVFVKEKCIYKLLKMGLPEIPEMPNEVQEQPDFPVNILSTGHTRIGRQI